MKRVTIKIDLVDVIRQAISQVYGSDERELLYQWLGTNTKESQMVTVQVSAYKSNGGPEMLVSTNRINDAISLDRDTLACLLMGFRQKVEIEADDSLDRLELNGALFLYDLCRFAGLSDSLIVSILGEDASSGATDLLEAKYSLAGNNGQGTGVRVHS